MLNDIANGLLQEKPDGPATRQLFLRPELRRLGCLYRDLLLAAEFGQIGTDDRNRIPDPAFRPHCRSRLKGAKSKARRLCKLPEGMKSVTCNHAIGEI